MRLIEKLNLDYKKLHTAYETLFWDSYMGNGDVTKNLKEAEQARDAFRANTKLTEQVTLALKTAKGEERKRLLHWKKFFSLFQTPAHAVAIKNKATAIEHEIAKIRQTRKEGYIDPLTNLFVEASENKMRTILRTNADEVVRKACFEALNSLPETTIDLYCELIAIRNEFARALGYENFYAYKLDLDEGMKLTDLFPIFEKLYEKTKGTLVTIHNLEKEKPGITKPWNFQYMTSGDFAKEEDSYFPFEKSLSRWGQSFSAIGADLAGGSIVLDLLDRKGKHNNGFCHFPNTVTYKGAKRVSGESRISCNAVLGEVGEGYSEGHITLFHEGGHAVHYLNSIQKDVILNHEYPPSSVSWAETQSMFMDTMLSSIEWRTRYANLPFELYEKRVRRNHFLAPLHILSIHSIMELELRLYQATNLSKEFILTTAKEVYTKFMGLEGSSLMLLNVPHVYSWESSAYYHGYGLAELQVRQWREYFYKKYGYIVDNPNIGKEMKKVWKLGASIPSSHFIKIATGKKLSSDAYIRSVTQTIEQKLADGKKRIKKLESIKRYTKPIALNGVVTIVHGNTKIADSKKGFEKMVETYRLWLQTKI